LYTYLRLSWGLDVLLSPCILHFLLADTDIFEPLYTCHKLKFEFKILIRNPFGIKSNAVYTANRTCVEFDLKRKTGNSRNVRRYSSLNLLGRMRWSIDKHGGQLTITMAGRRIARRRPGKCRLLAASRVLGQHRSACRLEAARSLTRWTHHEKKVGLSRLGNAPVSSINSDRTETTYCRVCDAMHVRGKAESSRAYIGYWSMRNRTGSLLDAFNSLYESRRQRTNKRWHAFDKKHD